MFRPDRKAQSSFVIDAMEAQDIDTLTDWRLAELKMQLARSDQ